MMEKISSESNYTTQAKVMFALTQIQDYMIKYGSKGTVSVLEVRKQACTEPIKILEGAFKQTLFQLGFTI